MSGRLRHQGIIFGLVWLVIFILFSIPVGLGAFALIDFSATTWLQNFFPRLLDIPLSFLSVLGTLEITTLILATILWQSKSPLKSWIFIFLGFFCLAAVEAGMKNFLRHPQPPPTFSRYDLPIVLPASHVETPYAYPSGHMGRTVYLLTVAWFVLTARSKKREWNASLIFGAIWVIMAASRVYLGEHWLTDVIGGSFLGISLAILAWETTKMPKPALDT